MEKRNLVKTFEEFMSEAADVPPMIAFSQGISASKVKIADLKKEIAEKPEQRDYIVAKIQVELEKIDSLNAKKNLLIAKDSEAKRKEMEKAKSIREKAAAAAAKEAAKRKP